MYGIRTWSRAFALAAIPCLFASQAAAGPVFGSEVLDDVIVCIDPVAVSATTVGPVGPFGLAFAMTGLAGDTATGSLYGLSPSTGMIYSIDTTTGAATSISGALFTNNPNGLAFDGANNRLYITNNNRNELLYFDLATGGRVVVGRLSGAGAVEGLGFDEVTGTLYGLDDNQDRVVTIDTTTAAATVLSDPLGPGIWRGLTFDPGSGKVFATSVGPTGVFAEIDPATGAVTLLGPISGIGAFVQGLAALPEPVLCYPDCDQSGTLDIFDFLCFQNAFVAGAPYACACEPDPACNIFDFLCFQNAFVVGCP